MISSIIFYSIIFLYTSLFYSLDAAEESTLEMVNVLFRHGDRTPVAHYPNDPYSDPSYWSEKPGQLTNTGKLTEYELGKWLRARYQNLVGKKFDPDETYVTSTDYDRTLMSAQCVLASFFYPNNSRFIESLPWMPVPIHSAPCGSDLLLNVDAACPRMDSENKKMLASDIVKNYKIRYKEVFEYLTNVTGEKVETFMAVDYIYDTLHIEEMDHLPLPNWTKSVYQKMRIMSGLSFKMITFTEELKRLRGGPLLGKITKDMLKKSLNESEIKNLYIYSAHDSTVSVLLNTMGVFNTQSPPYGATVLWELHFDKIKGHFVRLFYQNDTTMVLPPHQLVIPGCSEDCPLDQWQSLLNHLIPTDWNSECYRPDPLRDQYYIIGFSVTSVSLILAVITIIALLRRKSGDESSYRYQTLPGDTQES